MSRAGQPIVRAYLETGAAGVVCPRCGAEVGDWCRDEHGRTTRVPHVVRIAAARPSAEKFIRSTSAGSDRRDGRGSERVAADFSEPRRRPEGES